MSRTSRFLTGVARLSGVVAIVVFVVAVNSLEVAVWPCLPGCGILDSPVDEAAPLIVLDGLREDWPGGPATLRSRAFTREPNGTFWFGGEVLPDGSQVWFRMAPEDVERMREDTPAWRGRAVLAALVDSHDLDRPLHPGINRYEVRVSTAGEVWVDRLPW